jgi:hypothetical protein
VASMTEIVSSKLFQKQGKTDWPIRSLHARQPSNDWPPCWLPYEQPTNHMPYLVRYFNIRPVWLDQGLPTIRSNIRVLLKIYLG